MEPEIISIEAAGKALALLTWIPLVLFALWVEYFDKNLNELRIKKSQFDPNIEVEKIYTAGLIVILFQFILFFQASEVRHAYPILCSLNLIMSICIQIFLQSRAKNRVHGTEPTSNEFLRTAIRATLACIFGGSLYIAIVLITIKAAFVLAELTHASPLIGTTYMLLGGCIGVLTGLSLNFTLGPKYIQNILPTSRMDNLELQTRLQTLFTKSGLNFPDFFIIELKEIPLMNVLILGYEKGRGLFRPGLFISRSVFNCLSISELEAMVTNEISHLILKHLKKRLASSVLLMIVPMVLVVTVITIIKKFTGNSEAFDFLVPMTAFFSFIISFKYLSSQLKAHQWEADVHSIEKMGIRFQDWVNALRKLDNAIYPSLLKKDIGSSETERRIEKVRHYLDAHHVEEFEPESKSA